MKLHWLVDVGVITACGIKLEHITEDGIAMSQEDITCTFCRVAIKNTEQEICNDMWEGHG